MTESGRVRSKETVSEPCGSKSMSSTLRPLPLKAQAKLSAVELLPTPPLWLAMVKVNARVSPLPVVLALL